MTVSTDPLGSTTTADRRLKLRSEINGDFPGMIPCHGAALRPVMSATTLDHVLSVQALCRRRVRPLQDPRNPSTIDLGSEDIHTCCISRCTRNIPALAIASIARTLTSLSFRALTYLPSTPAYHSTRLTPTPHPNFPSTSIDLHASWETFVMMRRGHLQLAKYRSARTVETVWSSGKLGGESDGKGSVKCAVRCMNDIKMVGEVEEC